MRHIIGILLQNEAGALMRVASLFSTRGYNIESLNVAPTDDPAVSRVTLTTKGSDAVIQQIVSQLCKLIDAVNVEDMTRHKHVERELLLIKVRVAPQREDSLHGAVARAGGKVLSMSADCHIVELTSGEGQIDSFIREAGACGQILEVLRSGVVGISRGEQALHPAMLPAVMREPAA